MKIFAQFFIFFVTYFFGFFLKLFAAIKKCEKIIVVLKLFIVLYMALLSGFYYILHNAWKIVEKNLKKVLTEKDDAYIIINVAEGQHTKAARDEGV